MFFTKNNEMRMICTPDFSVKYSSLVPYRIVLPFISASFHSDLHAVIEDNDLIILGKNDEQLFKKKLSTFSRGLAIDLQENIIVCLMKDKLMQIKYRGGEITRYIELPDIKESYNVVLHPTGEKVLILDYCKIFCVYRVL